jgi:hypothetical protein
MEEPKNEKQSVFSKQNGMNFIVTLSAVMIGLAMKERFKDKNPRVRLIEEDPFLETNSPSKKSTKKPKTKTK